jgi:RNA polymerase sigma-70 factor (ECF subfamily)
MLSLLVKPAPQSAPTSSLHEEAAALRPVVRGVIACMLRERLDHPDVDDCTNEALRRALESPSQVHGPVRPWLLGIARYVALDAVRARQKSRARNVDLPEAPSSSTSTMVDRLADPTVGAQERLESAEANARVQRLLATLPEGPRRALELFHLEELPYPEIARRLDVPLGTVATWITRGRKAMAEALEDDLERAKTESRIAKGKA